MKLAVIALVTTLGLGGTSHADHASPGPRAEVRQRLLERFDRNQDGRLEPQERRRAIRALRMLARRLAMQERADRHARGSMHRFDRDDGAVGPRALRRERMFRRFDANGDGMIVPGEALRGRAHKLRRLDRNGDGTIGPDEMPQGSAGKLRRLDRNGDGAIGPDEMPQGRRRLDRNGDGASRPDEMPQGSADRQRWLDRDGDGASRPEDVPHDRTDELRQHEADGEGTDEHDEQP
jgi:hypothetical protein